MPQGPKSSTPSRNSPVSVSFSCDDELPMEDLDRRILYTNGDTGVSNVLDQRSKMLANAEIVFNLLVVGRTGIGKSTLINSLLNADLVDAGSSSHSIEDVQLDVKTRILNEKGVTVKLNLIETKGFGDQLNLCEHQPYGT